MKRSKLQKGDFSYMEIAKIIAARSHAVKKKVGCVIVKDLSIISDGYNGTPAGFDNECEIPLYDRALGLGSLEEHDEWMESMTEAERVEAHKPIGYHTKPHVLHAESNAIAKIARSTQSSEGATLYCTWTPCLQCAKLIIQAGIKRVVCGEVYKKPDGRMLLEKAGVLVVNLEEHTT